MSDMYFPKSIYYPRKISKWYYLIKNYSKNLAVEKGNKESIREIYKELDKNQNIKEKI
jgi:hypothetical protein